MMTRAARAVFGCLTILAGALAAGFSGASGSAASVNAAVDAVFEPFTRQGSPGCAVAIYKDGKIEYERGYGLASLEHELPITPASVFYLGSVSKQFTAFAAALAIKDGKLSADDPIRKHLPELPEYTSKITVRHLIHHTSGLRDYNTLLAIAGRRGDEAFDNATVLRITTRQKKLNFEPGSEYLYSNTGYTLLATIVERATKTPFARFTATRMFEPLEMHVTHFHTDETRLVQHRAFAFSRQGDGIVLDTPNNERAGAGGVFSSVRDLLKWDENFYTARVGGRDLIDMVQTPGKLNDGSPLNYAWGLQVGKYRGARLVEHSGSLGGYRAHLMRFPEAHYSLAALCNLSTSSPGGLLRQVADRTLAGSFTEGAPTSVALAGAGAPAGGGRAGRSGGDGAARTAVASASDYSGTYDSDEADATFTVTVRDGAVMLQRESDPEPAELQPASGGDFRFRGMTVRFVRDGGRVVALTVDAGRVRDVRFVKRSSS
jgi:CubicO group peptidase (beta-lactamase class C family)